MTKLTTCEVRDGLCVIALDRPEKLNALNLAVFEELDRHIRAFDPAQAGCVLLRGNGRSFCAGHDLDDLAAGNEGVDVERFETGVIEQLANLPVPVVAAVQGHCYTGGLELALAADVILASENAKFADTHSKWDLVPVWGLSQRLPRRVGVAKAKEMMFTSRVYSGQESCAMGLANHCFADELFASAVEQFCAEILANSRRSNRAVKRLMQDTEGMPLSQGIAWELHRSEGHGPDFHARLAAMR